MTRTEAQLALIERQRRYAWTLAREEHARAAARLIAGKTHELLNLVQIVELAAPELVNRCDEFSQEIIQDMARTAAASHAKLDEMLAVARPASQRTRGPAVGSVLAHVLGELGDAAAFGVDWALHADAATTLDAAALEHLAIGLVLDVASAPWIELTIRERALSGAPWIEIVRGVKQPPAGDHFDLELVELLAARAGGEVSASERRDGGTELVVALPVV